ncbi:class I SAM-dependent methyltransferase [Leptothermofonsia sichuanensis E412]|uniref:class I SAM-dependent methyltransferase n=1 Tax=Leptothermofonsia sichuanensis TaxID=2917832 RepID=UPI001CA7736F|nr:class I SAM-dependent methyltransferase [Leptothermofonsia sichuanensis]QZZ19720.1 class I SAM-dependent methyltransferase [Leptothermofonsia sichuanensis E412]
MTLTASPAPTLMSRLVNGILSIKPLANLAKDRARQMMIQRAEAIGVHWIKEVENLKARDWSADLAAVQNPDLIYPNYYLTSFHAYEEGDLGWEPALEVEVAAHTVHSGIWKEAGAEGDARLRQSYHDILKTSLPEPPRDIVDIGCSVGMSTFALQATYPNAHITGVDLSPYFLAVARYRTHLREQGNSYGVQAQFLPTPASKLPTPQWLHASAEATGLPDASFDLVSAFLIFHELPQDAAVKVLQEAHRLLRPGGYFAMMDMNPQSEIYARMPPYILTLLKSTEPYLDQYFTLDIEQALIKTGFEPPTIICNSPRHRTVIAQA